MILIVRVSRQFVDTEGHSWSKIGRAAVLVALTVLDPMV